MAEWEGANKQERGHLTKRKRKGKDAPTSWNRLEHFPGGSALQREGKVFKRTLKLSKFSVFSCYGTTNRLVSSDWSHIHTFFTCKQNSTGKSHTYSTFWSPHSTDEIQSPPLSNNSELEKSQNVKVSRDFRANVVLIHLFLHIGNRETIKMYAANSLSIFKKKFQ